MPAFLLRGVRAWACASCAENRGIETKRAKMQKIDPPLPPDQLVHTTTLDPAYYVQMYQNDV